MQVGFIGLGQMGFGMAANLIKAGHRLTLYNRTRSKAEALAGPNASVADRVADACRAEAVFTMLADDAALEGVVFGSDGMLANLPKDAVHVSSSTISVALSRRLAKAHAEAGQRYVSAPVFGRPDVAADGRLNVVAAGAPDALEAVSPLLEALSQARFVVSEDPAAANLVKLSGNFLITSVIESLGEAMALVAKAGIDKHAYLDMLTSTLFNAPVYKTYGALIADGKFQPVGFPALLGLKDVRLALQAGEELRVPMPVASLIRDRFVTLLAQGGGDLDWAAIGGLAAKDAGV